MPGITMEKEQEDEDKDKDSQIEEIVSPQRSILDFFRSPKSKDLLCTLGQSSPKQKNSTEPQSRKTDTENRNLNGLTNGIKNKKTVNKNLSLQLNSSVNDFDIGESSDAKSKKSYHRKCNKKSGKSKKDKELSNHTKDNDENADSCDIFEVNSDIKTRNVASIIGNKTKKNTTVINSHTENKQTEKREENITKNENIDCGMNYLDFLKSIEEKSKEKEDDPQNKHENMEIQKTEIRENAERKSQVNLEFKEKCLSSDTDEEKNEKVLEHNTDKVNYPSVKSFFTKLSGMSKNADTDQKQTSLKTVTTKAVVHSEPTAPKSSKGNNSTVIKVCSPVNEKLFNEIEILSSEVVTVDSPVKKSNKKKDKLQEKTAIKSRDKNSAGTIDISDDSLSVSTPEDKEAVERKKAFLQSTDTPLGSQKTSQSTLSFVKSGLQMSNKSSHTTRVRKSECEEISCESPLSKSTPLKRGRGRPPGSSKKQKSSSEGQKLEHEVLKESATKITDEKTATRKSLRKKYKVDMISIDTKNKTPIRMRLTRCNKSGSSTDDSFMSLKNKINLKQTKAQKLLDKAKKTKAAKSPEKKTLKKHLVKNSKKKTRKDDTGNQTKDDDEDVGKRRSSRLSGKLQISMEESQDDEVMIIDDEEEEDEKTKGKKKKREDHGTPRKDKHATTPKTPRGTKTPKKPQGKLAPIFMKKKPGESIEEPKKIVLDPEQERQKREFLMSGVPEALKKQTLVANAAVIACDLPPFPSIKHVQQMGEIVGKSGVDMWSLSSVDLKYREFKGDINIQFSKHCWNKSLLEKVKLMSDLTKLKTFSQHPKIEENLIEPLLKEIQRVSPSYNVEKMYKVIKEKKEDQDAEMTNEVEEFKEIKPVKGEEVIHVNGQDKKKSRRRSLRLKKKEEVMEVIDLGSPEPANKQDTSSVDSKQDIAIVVPWTDKYQPTHSSEVVGNSNNVKKLKSWLIEWKHRVCKEARKMKKIMLKESKSKATEKASKDDWWADDDSDFDLDSDESEDDEDKLCNTVMLMGPPGVGKTTTVYALAQEIGFKVFEVNASSTRNGKRILSQLQEATQSHRVSHTKISDIGSGSLLNQGIKSSPVKKPEKNLPTSFANFFKKASTTTPIDVEKPKKLTENKKGRKRKRDLEESDVEKTPKKKKGKKNDKGIKLDGLIPTTSNQATASNQGLNLESTSLILFEDVDIVFEEDKGFWSSIQTFMSTTKIPIVLTTNDVTLSSKFDGRYEQFLFKTPSMKQITIYLQMICLAEGIRTNSEEIMTLVKVLSGDIRHCLLALQYWVDSGGGTLQENQKIISPVRLKPILLDNDTCSKDTNCDENSKSKLDNDDDDFVCMKPAINRRKRVLISDDDSSNSAQPFPSSLQTISPPNTVLQSVIHLSCLNSSLGLSVGGTQGIMNLLKQLLKGQNDDLITIVTEACDQYRKLMYNIVYNTYIDLLPMPKSRCNTPPSLKASKGKEKKSQLKRIKIFDLYDSEASNDGILDQPAVTENIEEEIVSSESKEEKGAIVQSLDSLTEFYDNMSFIDSITSSSEKPDTSNSFILHSKRRLNDKDVTNSLDHIDKDNLCSQMEVRMLLKLCTTQSNIQNSLKNKHIESLSLPSISSQSQGALVNRASNSTNLIIKKASNNVMSNLPLGIRCHQRSVVMDYMPTLREICKSEKIRETAKVKRRFHHYFDNIGLNLKDTTLDVMYTSFQ